MKKIGFNFGQIEKEAETIFKTQQGYTITAGNWRLR